VTYPAYPQTDVSVARRSLDSAMAEFTEAERQARLPSLRTDYLRRRQLLAELLT